MSIEDNPCDALWSIDKIRTYYFCSQFVEIEYNIIENNKRLKMYLSSQEDKFLLDTSNFYICTPSDHM